MALVRPASSPCFFVRMPHTLTLLATQRKRKIRAADDSLRARRIAGLRSTAGQRRLPSLLCRGFPNLQRLQNRKACRFVARPAPREAFGVRAACSACCRFRKPRAPESASNTEPQALLLMLRSRPSPRNAAFGAFRRQHPTLERRIENFRPRRTSALQ